MAGRKRKPGVREPNGRARRPPTAAIEAEARSVALDARMRVYGASKAIAEGMHGTNWLAYLVATGELKQRQYDAAMGWQELCEDYHKLHPVKRYPEAGNLDRGGGYDGTEDGDDE